MVYLPIFRVKEGNFKFLQLPTYFETKNYYVSM